MTEENLTDIIKLIKWQNQGEYNTILFESGRELLMKKSIEELQSILGQFILRSKVILETDITGKILTKIKPISKKFPWKDLDGNIKEIEF